MSYLNPSVADFKTRFTRDFPYGVDVSTSITDADIANACVETNNEISQEVWESQAAYTQAYLFLTAHFLSMDLRAASQGVQGTGRGSQVSKGVGPISGGFALPQRVIDSPSWAAYMQTTYGKRYLDMLIPRSAGSCFSVPGSTQP